MPQARDEAGNIWEVDAQGNAVRLVQPAQSAGQIIETPPAPTAPFEVPKAQADLARTETDIADTRADNAREDAKMRADLFKQGLEIGEDGQIRRVAGQSASVDPMKLAQFRALEEQIARVEQLFAQGPGSTKGVAAIKDYLPSDANAAFDSASAGLGEVGLAAFRVPGVGSQSDAELRQFVTANTPSASDRDAAIREKIGNLRRRLEATKEELGMMPNAMLGANAPAPMVAAGAGATQQAVPIPPEMQQAHAAWVAQNAGRITPDSYASFRAQLDRQFGFNPNEDAYREAAPAINQASTNSGFSPTIPPANQDMTEVAQLRNDIASSPGGAALTGLGDALSLGVIRAAEPDRMAALEAEQPFAIMAGQIGGTIAGTGGIAAAARMAASRLTPRLLGGAGRAQFGRNLAADAAYGAGYGGVTDGDPLTGAALGAAGSAIGQGLGGAIGKAVAGVDVSPAAQALQARNIPVTTGQMLGGFAKRMEDRAASMPLIGDMIAARQSDGLDAFNREALTVAGEPIGFAPTATGRAGFEQLVGDNGAIGRAYDSATAGVRVPVDVEYGADLMAIQQLADRLPPDAIPALDRIGENYAMPIANAGELTGDVFQNTQRALKMKRNSPPIGAQGFEQEWKDATSALMQANRALMNRQGGDAVVQGLDSADFANRMAKTVQNAAERADGNDYIFTPSQLQDAVKATQRKFPGKNPLQSLADDGQQVLPSRIPNSGTADRLAQMGTFGAVPAALGAIGYGASGGDGAQTGALTGAALTLAAILGGTKGGQKAINAALASRSPFFDQLGNSISRRKGLFGSSLNPVMQQAQ